MHRFWVTKYKYGVATIAASALLLTSGVAQAVDVAEVRIPVQVFADVGAFARTDGSATTSGTSSTNDKFVPERNGAFVGSLTLFAAPQLGDRVRSLFELMSDFIPSGSNVITVERAQIGYVFNDAVTAWGGRFHTPYGYWNTAYHHGAQLQPSISRPVQLSGSLPAHIVGLWVTGQFNAGSGKLTYDLYGGNSTRVSGGAIDPNHTSGNNKNKNIGFNFGYNAGEALEGLRVGVHGLEGKVTECGTINTSGSCDVTAADVAVEKSKVSMTGAYAHYDNYNVEFIAEYYRFKNTNLISVAAPDYEAKSSSSFVQAGYTLGDWTPFMRYEKTRYDQADEYFKNLANGKSYNKGIVGVRYELNSNAVLKGEVAKIDSITAPNLDDSEEVRVQYAIRF